MVLFFIVKRGGGVLSYCITVCSLLVSRCLVVTAEGLKPEDSLRVDWLVSPQTLNETRTGFPGWYHGYHWYHMICMICMITLLLSQVPQTSIYPLAGV